MSNRLKSQPKHAPNWSDCFVISPIADQTSDGRAFVRWKVDYLLKHVIRPVCEAQRLKARRMDERDGNGLIPEEMVEKLAADPLAVAVLERGAVPAGTTFSGIDEFNANVVYEIGLRHAWCKPVVVMAPDDPPRLPFDLRDVKPVHYPEIEQDPRNPRKGLPWTASVLRSVQNTLKTRLVNSVKENKASKRYGQALRMHMEMYGLELVCEMKRRSLLDLSLALVRFRKDTDKDYEVKRKSSRGMTELAGLIELPQKAFLADGMSYRRIANERLSHVHRVEDVVALCKEMDSIDHSMAELVQVLRATDLKRLPLKGQLLRKIDTLSSMIERTIASTQKVIKLVAHV